MEKEIKKETLKRTSNLSGCFECNWEGEGGREARKHCQKTGHKTWNEYNVVFHWELLK